MKSTRCVIWHPKGQAVDPELVGALRAKSIELSHRADNEFAAFASVCSLARSVDAPQSATVLLIVEPRRHLAASQLTKLLARYPVRAAVWVYDHTTQPRLRAASPRDFGEPAPASPAPVITKSPATPKLRLASDEPPAPKPVSPSPSHLLTDEELALLLATEPKKDI